MFASEEFYTKLTQKIGEEEARRTLETATELVHKSFEEPFVKKQGLLFGQVQSGKTNNIIMAIAKAADAGIRFFIVLTSDNLWLYKQTCERLREGLPQLITVDKENWGITAMEGRIKTAHKRKGIVFCSTKNRRILEDLQQTIRRFDFPREERAFIIDDEADQASLNTETNRDTEPSAVSAAIQELRNGFENHRFVQVTATPQALFLQCAGDAFRPDFVVTFSPGRDYIGGDHFFGAPARESLIRFIPETEPDSICGARRIPSGFAVPTGFRQAMCLFLVGAAIKGLRCQGTEFSSLFHISHTKSSHESLEILANNFLQAVMESLGAPEGSSGKELLLQYLAEARNDLASTAIGALPDLTSICEMIDNRIGSTNVQVLNSSYPDNPISGAFFNVFIGGNRLGRGVTISRLLVTYYGRSARYPQLDTMLQHARMYGYRAKDLDVIRFCTTRTLYELFCNINDSDNVLRRAIEAPDAVRNIHAVMLSRSSGGLMRPTRSNVLPLSEISLYLPGTRYFPYSPLVSNVAPLDALLRQYDGRSDLARVSIDFILSILNLTRSERMPSESWNDEAIRACVLNLRELYDNRAFLVVRTNRDIKRGFRAMLSPTDADLFDPTAPTLTMYRFTGSKSQGWDGNPFWVPNLRFPDGDKYFIFTPT